MKGIDNILKPLYDLWHKVMDKMSVVKDRVVIDGHEVVLKFIVENIKALTDEQCELLECGDVVAKKTSNQFHCYKVTYKEDKHGLVLTYMDASVIEGQSYDYTEGHWVYNSEDITHPGGHTDNEVKGLALDAIEAANSGTIADSLGLDSSGNLVKGQASGGGGTKLYKHVVTYEQYKTITIISLSNTNLNTQYLLQVAINSEDSLKCRLNDGNYYNIMGCNTYSGSGTHLILSCIKQYNSTPTVENKDLGTNLTMSDTVTEL